MPTDAIITDEDLISNPTPRLPIVLCLDTSFSMHGDPIDELQEGVESFYRSVRADEVSKHTAEISVLTFGGTVTSVAGFKSVQEEHSLPTVQASGSTPMGGAVELALDKLEERKSSYQSAGVDYYQPWLVIMTDGAPTDDIDRAVNRIAGLVEGRRLSVFAIGIGKDADMDVLSRFSPKFEPEPGRTIGRRPLRLVGLKFNEFFEWLSKSVQRVSASTPGQTIPLDISSIGDWGKID